MKKSELRKVIREIISEQLPIPTTMCEPSENCVPPEFLQTSLTYGGSPSNIGGASNTLKCPEGFIFQMAPSTGQMFGNNKIIGISNCVPDIGAPGDSNMAGHGSPDNPFMPGMGFEDQYIDQITGPGGPFGGGKDGGKGKPIRESKKRRR